MKDSAMPPDHWWTDPNLLLSFIVPCSSMAGLGELLRSGRTLHWRAVASSVINSGVIGFIVGTILMTRVQPQDYLMVAGFSVLAGCGGSGILVLLVEATKVYVPQVIHAILVATQQRKDGK